MAARRRDPDYSLIFDGLNRLTPVDGRFLQHLCRDIRQHRRRLSTSAQAGGTLTLTGGVTNNSANAQTLNVPVVLGAPVTVNAASADLTLGQTINNGGNLLTITDGGHNITVNGAICRRRRIDQERHWHQHAFRRQYLCAATSPSAMARWPSAGAGQLGGGCLFRRHCRQWNAYLQQHGGTDLVGKSFPGPARLNQNGSGPLTLSAANTFGGPTTITAARCKLANSAGAAKQHVELQRRQRGFQRHHGGDAGRIERRAKSEPAQRRIRSGGIDRWREQLDHDLFRRLLRFRFIVDQEREPAR